MQISGKVVMVTGASQGIGAAAARQLAAAGARVVLAARSGARLAAEVAAIAAAGGDARAFELDVTSSESVEAAVAEVLAEYGAIDVLVNNAGSGGQLDFHIDRDPRATRELFEVHLFGSERMIRAVLPSMLARGRGRIVNVVSTVAYVPMPGAAAYSAAKAAVIALTRALRGELAHTPIELVLFSPPHTQTDAGRAWPLDLPKQFSPEYAAEALLDTLRRDRSEWLAGGNNMLLWLQRVSPSWAASIMRDLGLKATHKVRAERSQGSCR
jgi:NAD(P)-dependent dehydrogenase (short-subunit alcohol dehydrogenase family)